MILEKGDLVSFYEYVKNESWDGRCETNSYLKKFLGNAYFQSFSTVSETFDNGKEFYSTAILMSLEGDVF